MNSIQILGFFFEPSFKPVVSLCVSRTGFWENCRAAYEDVVKHLER